MSPFARITIGEEGGGFAVILLTVDYLIWSESAKELLTTVSAEKIGELWVSAALSRVAESEIKTLGWNIQTQAEKKLVPE